MVIKALTSEKISAEINDNEYLEYCLIILTYIIYFSILIILCQVISTN